MLDLLTLKGGSSPPLPPPTVSENSIARAIRVPRYRAIKNLFFDGWIAWFLVSLSLSLSFSTKWIRNGSILPSLCVYYPRASSESRRLSDDRTLMDDQRSHPFQMTNKTKNQTWLAPKVIWATVRRRVYICVSLNHARQWRQHRAEIFLFFYSFSLSFSLREKKTRSNGNRKGRPSFLLSSSLIVSFIPVFFFLPRIRPSLSFFFFSSFLFSRFLPPRRAPFARGPARACVFLGRWRRRRLPIVFGGLENGWRRKKKNGR